MTATQLQFRRGTAAQMATFTGAQGEIVVDTSNNRAVVHDGTTAGGWPAARVAEVNPQCGRLSFVSATQIKFAPFNGGSIKIAGALYAIPSAGIAAANTSVYVNGVAGQNLAAATLYYVYLFNNAGTLTIDFSTTGHATDSAAGNLGVEIKSGDNSRTLVGMVYANASAQFEDDGVWRGVASWFNRRPKLLTGNQFSVGTSSQNAWVELSTNARCFFANWGGDSIVIGIIGDCYVSSLNCGTAYFNIGLDGIILQLATNLQFTNFSTNVAQNLSGMTALSPAEAGHYVTPLGCQSGASGVTTLQGQMVGFVFN